ncbi:MAG: YafY family protein [Nakamurella sp.]
MLDTSARLLRMLSLLQVPREWTGPQLSERLEVTPRTIRKDIERLRSLGYPVTATPGKGGGYRLGAGAALPPLLLDDDEAIAVAVGLRTAASAGVEGIEEASLRALGKLEQVLPSRLRYRLNTLQAAMAALPRPGPAVAPDVLTMIAGAIRDHERLRFDYLSSDDTTSARLVQPYLLVHIRERWYLAAWDEEKQDWRTFRADRIRPRIPNGARFTPREQPPGGILAQVERNLGSAAWRYRSTVKVHAPAATVAARLPRWVLVEAIDAETCWAHVGSDDPQALALWLGALNADFEVTDSPELAAVLDALAQRYLRAVG